MKTHWKKLTNPNYLGAYDFQQGEKRIVTIKEVKQEKVQGSDGKSDDCIVAYFTEGKPMILNVTNCKAIAKAHGTNYIEEWNGLNVTLYVTMVSAFGQTVEALRIEPVKPKSLPSLTSDRFTKAIKALQDGKVTKESITTKYELTDAQLSQIDAI